MSTKLIRIPLKFLSSLGVFMTSNKFILACVIFQCLLSFFILAGEFLFKTNIAVFLVGWTLPCVVPILFYITIFLCGQYFYTEFKRYNLVTFLFTLFYFIAIIFLIVVILLFGNSLYESLAIFPKSFFPLPPEEFCELGMIKFSNFAATDIPLSQLKITNDSAEITIYFDFMLQNLILDAWPEGFPKKAFSYFINNLVVEISMFRK
jgi:hypothetical protein